MRVLSKTKLPVGPVEQAVGFCEVDFLMPMRKLFFLCSCALLTIAGLAGKHAEAQDQWLSLGEASTSTASTYTYIPADTGKGTFCAVRFKTEGGLVNVTQINVHFGNSQSMRIVTPNYSVDGNKFSPSIPLPGMRRTIKGVDVIYKLGSSPSTAPTMVLWGNVLANSVVCSK
jgi:hypothetical protein